VLAADVVIVWRSAPLVAPPEAYRYANMAMEAQVKTKSVIGAVMAHWAMAQAHVHAGKPAAAIPEFRLSADRIAQTGVLKGTLPTVLAGLVEALLEVDVTQPRDALDATLTARGPVGQPLDRHRRRARPDAVREQERAQRDRVRPGSRGAIDRADAPERLRPGAVGCARRVRGARR
jgi:hypothetical protein